MPQETVARRNSHGTARHDHHDHDHDHEHGSELSETQLRVRALETILTEKGLCRSGRARLIIEAYETKIGPHNGARVVAKAWSDPAFKQALLEDATKAVATLGLDQPRRRSSGRGREHAGAAQHDRLHAVLLLSVGGARPAAGLVQVGALSLARGQGSARRARRFRRDAAGRHAKSGCGIRPPRPASSCCRCGRPAPRAGARSELATLVTRDSMIGTGLPKRPDGGCVMNGIHDMGGMDGFGKVEPEPNEPVFHAAWEGRCLAHATAPWAASAPGTSTSRAARIEQLAAAGLSRRVLLRQMGAAPGEAWSSSAGSPAPTRSPPATRCARASRSARKLDAADVAKRADARLVRPAGAGAGALQGRRPRAHQEHPPATHTRLPRYARGRVGIDRSGARLSCVPGFGRDRQRREPAMALHRGVRRPRAVGRGCRPDAQGLDRCVRALSGGAR